MKGELLKLDIKHVVKLALVIVLVSPTWMALLLLVGGVHSRSITTTTLA